MSGKPRDPKKRFFEKVNKTESGCWEWTASKWSNGYGQFFTGKNKINAHRFSFILAYGDIADGLNVCHKCDNRSCVNPEHLFLGTQKDNMQDMLKKGRKVTAYTEGIFNGRAFLTEEKVLDMRSLYDSGASIAEIARRFDTSETQTARAVKRRSWQHI